MVCMDLDLGAPRFFVTYNLKPPFFPCEQLVDFLDL